MVPFPGGSLHAVLRLAAALLLQDFAYASPGMLSRGSDSREKPRPERIDRNQVKIQLCRCLKRELLGPEPASGTCWSAAAACSSR